jgi:hypothetical protein
MRGLPRRLHLQNLSIATVLETVVARQSVNDQGFSEDEKAALQTCFRRGWLHSDSVGDTRYFFASPLHQVFVEGILYRPMSATIPEETLQKFVIAICHTMSPLNLQVRQVGAACIQRPPEAQYGDVFYQACLAHTRGSVRTLSEYGTKEGRIDFFIPSRGWGIEILRDGKDIREHNDRFVSGAYSKWITGKVMEDYIILDFRGNNPRAKHPGKGDCYCLHL